MRRRVVCLIALLGSACGGGTETHPSEAGVEAGDGASGEAGEDRPVRIELGSGETAFEPTEEEQHLKLYAGTQGGHHVWLSYRVEGLLPDGVRMTLDVEPAPPARPAHSDVKLDLDPNADGSEGYEFIGWPAQILDPECAVGSVVSISLTLTDSRGQQVSGAMRVIPDPPDLGFTRTCTR